MEPVHAVPGSMTRVDRCSAGQRVTYRFVAQRVGNADSTTTAFGPRLTVQFFLRRI